MTRFTRRSGDVPGLDTTHRLEANDRRSLHSAFGRHCDGNVAVRARARSMAWIRAAAFLTSVLGALAINPAAVTAQQPSTVQASDTLWQVTLTDGSRIIGQIRSSTPTRLSIVTTAGATIELDRTGIRSLVPARGTVRNGALWPRDPNGTRLFFGPTGRQLEKGEGYAGVFELFLPFVAYGVTDYLTVAGGTPIFPGGLGKVFYLAPRIGTRLGESTALSAGVLSFHDLTGDADDRTVGAFYLVGTRGSEDNAITAGAGWGFAGTDVANNPLLMLGLEARVSPRIKLLSENYLLVGGGDTNGSMGVASAGVRIIGERLSADLGIGCGFEVGGGDGACGLPLLNFVYNFR